MSQRVKADKAQSRRRGSRYPKLSKWQGCQRRLWNWSKPDCGVCTDEQKLHTEAMRPDEVTHHTEVQNFLKKSAPK